MKAETSAVVADSSAGSGKRAPAPAESGRLSSSGHNPTAGPGSSSAARIAEVIGDLPAMPHIAGQVLDKLSDDDSNPREISQLITKDQALAAKVLKVANSPFYGASRSIATMNDSLVFLGFESVKALIVTAVLKGIYSKVGLAEKLLWEHSVGCGLAAKKIAEEVRYRRKDEAYLAGLMHDIGKTALFLHAPEAMGAIMENVYNDGSDFFEAERVMFGFTHAQVGGAIANKWCFASDIEQAIAGHHEPDQDKSANLLTQIVSAANSLCHKLGVGPIKKPDLDIDSVDSLKSLALNPERLEKIMDAVKEALHAEPGGI